MKSLKTAQKPLTSKQYALLFSQLARMAAAGLPAIQAVTLISQTDSSLAKYARQLTASVQAGHSFTVAGTRLGLFTPAQQAMLQAAELSGQLPSIYSHLAAYHQSKASRLTKIKSQLSLPVFTLVLSIFLGPIAGLITGSLSPASYLVQCISQLLAIFLPALCLLKLPQICRFIGIEGAWHRLQLRLSIIKNWLVNRQFNDFLWYLALLLEAGIPFQQALPQAVATLPNTALQARFKPVLQGRFLSAGNSVYATCAAVPGFAADTLSIINSSEQSGKLASGMQHYCKIKAEQYVLQDDTLAAWLPRIIYLLIAVSIARGIIGAYTQHFEQLNALVP